MTRPRGVPRIYRVPSDFAMPAPVLSRFSEVTGVSGLLSVCVRVEQMPMPRPTPHETCLMYVPNLHYSNTSFHVTYRRTVVSEI